MYWINTYCIYKASIIIQGAGIRRNNYEIPVQSEENLNGIAVRTNGDFQYSEGSFL